MVSNVLYPYVGLVLGQFQSSVYSTVHYSDRNSPELSVCKMDPAASDRRKQIEKISDVRLHTFTCPVVVNSHSLYPRRP